MKDSDLKDRTKKYALRIIKLYTAIPKNTIGQTIGKQVLRSGTSVGAQYHEGCRAKSNTDLISKFEGVLQELEETLYWLELMIDAGVFSKEKLDSIIQETEELISIFVASVKKLKN